MHMNLGECAVFPPCALVATIHFETQLCLPWSSTQTTAQLTVKAPSLWNFEELCYILTELEKQRKAQYSEMQFRNRGELDEGIQMLHSLNNVSVAILSLGGLDA